MRARDTYEDAQILAERNKWNSTINRLYYAAYYAVMALLLKSDLKPTTHNGAKSNFSEYFILPKKVSKEYGKMYSQLFTWRQKGDYDDMFDFNEEKVMPYFAPVLELINLIEEMAQE
ncbi:HEPN domain-containing protein [uncultured Imperialibacter sp.]|uniref:HEPN domain-containing protein n=1 Tax=uncultured Imperialibacter sp. TaxID=1672639 RepID=UPI0030D94ED0